MPAGRADLCRTYGLPLLSAFWILTVDKALHIFDVVSDATALALYSLLGTSYFVRNNLRYQVEMKHKHRRTPQPKVALT